MTDKPLPSLVRSRVNRIAHSAGLKHATALRTRLLAELRRQVANGRTQTELDNYLDEVERCQ